MSVIDIIIINHHRPHHHHHHHHHYHHHHHHHHHHHRCRHYHHYHLDIIFPKGADYKNNYCCCCKYLMLTLFMKKLICYMLLGKSGAVERDQETINCTVYCLETQRQHRRTSLGLALCVHLRAGSGRGGLDDG